MKMNNNFTSKEFIINYPKLLNLTSSQFYDFLNFCEVNRKENKFFEDLYNFLDIYSYDFAAEYIGDDL